MPTNQNAAINQRQISVKEPVLLQGDFRKVSGISSEIFRQIEAVENDHDASTAAALEVWFLCENAFGLSLNINKKKFISHLIGRGATW